MKSFRDYKNKFCLYQKDSVALHLDKGFIHSTPIALYPLVFLYEGVILKHLKQNI